MSSSRKLWDVRSMESAIRTVLKRDCGYLKASKLHSVPLTTLKRLLNKIHDKKIPLSEIRNVIELPLGRRPVLPFHLEKELVTYCLQIDGTFFGSRRRDIKKIAFQLALRNNIPNPFSPESGLAGKKWLKGFLKRHPISGSPYKNALIAAKERQNKKEAEKITKEEQKKLKQNGQKLKKAKIAEERAQLKRKREKKKKWQWRDRKKLKRQRRKIKKRPQNQLQTHQRLLFRKLLAHQVLVAKNVNVRLRKNWNFLRHHPTRTVISISHMLLLIPATKTMLIASFVARILGQTFEGRSG